MSSTEQAQVEPSHDTKGPTVYEEAYDMLSYASMMYFVSEFRAMAREGKLHNCDTVLSLPLTLGKINKVYEEHSELLNELHGQNRHNLHGRVLETMMSKKSIDPEQPDGTKFVVFADDDADELVYSIAIDYSTRNVVVAFRGTVTSNDMTADIKAFQKKVPNPLCANTSNPLDPSASNPVSAEKINTAQPRLMRLHNGFHQYLFRQSAPEHKSKFELILEQAASVLQEHKGFRLYVTGHSLGGALCTLFSFYAALNPVFVDPVICYSFASPKLGTLSFRKALQALEAEGKLRLLRVANKDDPVTVLPRDAFTILPSDLGCAMEFVCFTQGRIYRHVGMGLLLYRNGTHNIFHARYNTNYFRTLMSDWAKLWARIFYVLIMTLLCCLLCRGKKYRAYHGYPAYFSRLKDNKNELHQLRLEELYSSFESGDKEVVKTRYW